MPGKNSPTDLRKLKKGVLGAKLMMSFFSAMPAKCLIMSITLSSS